MVYLLKVLLVAVCFLHDYACIILILRKRSDNSALEFYKTSPGAVNLALILRQCKSNAPLICSRQLLGLQSRHFSF